jgi:hypothetical protein
MYLQLHGSILESAQTLKLANIQMQKTGAELVCKFVDLLPASDLGRSMDVTCLMGAARKRCVVIELGGCGYRMVVT